MPSSGVQTCALRSEEHTSELQSHDNLVCRRLLEKKSAAVTERATENDRSSAVTGRAERTDTSRPPPRRDLPSAPRAFSAFPLPFLLFFEGAGPPRAPPPSLPGPSPI